MYYLIGDHNIDIPIEAHLSCSVSKCAMCSYTTVVHWNTYTDVLRNLEIEGAHASRHQTQNGLDESEE